MDGGIALGDLTRNRTVQSGCWKIETKVPEGYCNNLLLLEAGNSCGHYLQVLCGKR